MIAEVCLNAFKNALREINPSASVQKALSVHDGKLFVLNRTYELDKNVHLVALGKAAPAMVEGAERVLAGHIPGRGCVSACGDNVLFTMQAVVTGIPPGLKTNFYTGAENNLPDEKAMENTRRIEQFMAEAKSLPDQLILFLISGGGSALLPAPIPGVSLNEKVELIRLLQNNGADIKQLNAVRTALSRVKGGGLAKSGHPSKMISLIISDIVGDPLELISSGPTIISEKPPVNPIAVLNQLGILDKVPTRLVEVLQSAHLSRIQSLNNRCSPVDALNLIIASNSILLNALTNQIKSSSDSSSMNPFIVTNRLEGNATEGSWIGRRLLISFRTIVSTVVIFASPNRHALFLLFGGESTVLFDVNKAAQNAKGGRNQEMVLSALHQLTKDRGQSTAKRNGHFALFSIGSDGQDGPTDAAGAFLTDADLEGLPDSSASEIEQYLKSKCSYQFWSEYKNGQNLVKTGKTGVNVMDVQMLVLDFGTDNDW
ncbi:hypothetical protein GPALN_005282 [Globodera pallida]|nr:hypothetical protein GPALN_005282 [Globodera pallida]